MSDIKFTTKDVTQPKSGYEVLTNIYCICENGNPKNALFYGQSIQGNKNREIQEYFLTKEAFKNHPQPLEIVHLPVAYIPRRDY